MRKLIAVLLLSSIYYSDVIHVPDDHATIQEGLTASSNGDTVIVAPGTYYENVLLGKEILLASHAIYDELGADWQDNENINNTVISGDHNGSAMIIRYGNIEPTVLGFTFQDGTGTSMLVDDCGSITQKRSGGGILIYKAYPTINYNRFINNGFDEEDGGGGTSESVADGGAIGHYASDDVEFDEDRNHSSGELAYVDFADLDAVRDYILESAIEDSDESNTTRTIPDEMNIKYNYFEGNRSGDGENFYSLGFEGSIDVSHSTFEDIDCESNSVNKFVLRSAEDGANFVQNEISGNCIEDDTFYISNTGNDANAGTESDPLKTIGHALTLVRDSESATTTTINLYPGVYSPSTNGEKFPIVLPDNVHLIGDESESTILDAEADASNEAAVMIIKEVENVTVANLSLTGGSSEGHGCTGGGGLLLTANDMFNLGNEDGSSVMPSYPVIENVIIENNESHNGGGLSFFRVNGPVLNNVIVRNNTATAFGGGMFSYVSTMTMTDVTITENQNQGYGQGGGVMLAASQGSFDNMTITNNYANASHGGGIWTNNSGGEGNHSDGWTMTNSVISGNTGDCFGGGITSAWSHPILINCTISENTSGWGGGGIFALEAGFTLKESMVSDNSSSGDGGGIYAWGPLYGIEGPVIEDCIVSGNTTGSNAGGIGLEEDVDAIITRTFVVDNHAAQYIGGINVYGTDATFNNITISGNTSSNGGAIGLIFGGYADLTNSILWNNGGEDEVLYGTGGGALTSSYSNIGGSNGAGEGNIDADPLFVDADNGDYTLQGGSPCIDAGTADIDGDGVDDMTDYFGGAPDMGAFEFYIAATGLQYTVDNSSVIFNWDPIENVQYYQLERSTDPAFVEDVVLNFAMDNSYTDNGLEWDTEYFYRVAAFIGYWTDYSNVVSVTLEFVGTDNADAIPETYAVHQNYPNPFNPVTTLRYDLPEDGLVNITIYDMMGRAVKTLVNEHQTAGYRSTQWNATNDAGSPLSAGMYLYTIQAGDFRQTRKMVLLK